MCENENQQLPGSKRERESDGQSQSSFEARIRFASRVLSCIGVVRLIKLWRPGSCQFKCVHPSHQNHHHHHHMSCPYSRSNTYCNFKWRTHPKSRGQGSGAIKCTFSLMVMGSSVVVPPMEIQCMSNGATLKQKSAQEQEIQW